MRGNRNAPFQLNGEANDWFEVPIGDWLKFKLGFFEHLWVWDSGEKGNVHTLTLHTTSYWIGFLKICLKLGFVMCGNTRKAYTSVVAPAIPLGIISIFFELFLGAYVIMPGNP